MIVHTDGLSYVAAHGKPKDISFRYVDSRKEVHSRVCHSLNRVGNSAVAVTNPDVIVDDDLAILRNSIDKQRISSIHAPAEVGYVDKGSLRWFANLAVGNLSAVHTDELGHSSLG